MTYEPEADDDFVVDSVAASSSMSSKEFLPQY